MDLTHRSPCLPVPPAPDPLHGHVAVVAFGPLARPHHGMAVRARAVLRALAELGLDVTVLSVGEDDTTGWEGARDGRLVPLPGGPPWRWVAALRRGLSALEPPPDCVVVESALLLAALPRLAVPLCWDTNECESLHYARLPPSTLTRARGLAWRVLERWSARRAAVVVAVSDAEAQAWRTLVPEAVAKVRVVRHVLPAPPSLPMEAAPDRRRPALDLPPRYVLLLGNLSAKHNAAAARWAVRNLPEVLPPGVALVLAGPGSERLAAGTRGGLPAPSPVLALGEVADADELVRRAAVCLAPLASGAGVKTKVLHYLAHGRPVLGTPLAFEGIEDAPGCHSAPLAELPARLRELLEDPAASEAPAPVRRSWAAERGDPRRQAAEWRGVLAPLLGGS
jgi:hypothetical protein